MGSNLPGAGRLGGNEVHQLVDTIKDDRVADGARLRRVDPIIVVFGTLLVCLGSAVAEATRLSSVVAAPAPDWVLAIKPGTWVEIGTNTLSDVDPAQDPAANPAYPSSPPWRGATGQKAVVNAWNGGAFAANLGRLGSLVVFGGGHNDYFGNEVYAFDLEELRWRRLTDPFPASRDTLTAFYEDAEFADGSPVPPHTYDYVDYHPGTNSFVLLRGVQQLGVSGGSFSGSPAHMLSFGDHKWRRSPPSAAPYGSSGWSAYDALRDVFWINPPGSTPAAGFRSFDPNGVNTDGSVGRWSEAAGPRKQGGGDGMASYDPDNDIIVYTDFKKVPARVLGVDLKRPGDPSITLPLAGSPPQLDTGHGWEWSDLRKSFIYWPKTAGADVHELRLGGADWRRGPWAWSSLTSRDNAVVPQSMTAANGVFSRFRVVRFSNAEIAVVVNRVDGPVYAFRLPEIAAARPSASAVEVHRSRRVH